MPIGHKGKRRNGPGGREVDALTADLGRARKDLVAAGERLHARGHEAAIRLRSVEQERQLLERIIKSVPAGIAYLDRNLVYQWVNPAYARLLGTDPEHLVNRCLFDVLPEAEAQLGPILREVLETGKPFIGTEFPFKRVVDGQETTVYWDFSCVPILDAHGGVDGVLVLDIDVSERAEQAARSRKEIGHLKELDRIKDEFLSVVSHELRTPLNFIMGFANLLEDEAAGPINAQQHEFVQRLLNGAGRMLSLVNDLLDVAKIKAGKLDLYPVPTPYAPLVEEVVASMKPLAEDKGLTIDTDVRTALLPCIDGGRIAQVLTNLIGNAIKFTNPGGRITVRVYVQGDELITQISDTGVGIAQQDLPKLFTRFTQLDMTHTRQAGGTGLGLAITKALVEAHGGRMEVVSEVGRGSSFYVRLPLKNPACPTEP
jgi:PAS domain S-box-containing protein